MPPGLFELAGNALEEVRALTEAVQDLARAVQASSGQVPMHPLGLDGLPDYIPEMVEPVEEYPGGPLVHPGAL